jgi:hypothetical protein
VVPRTAPCGLFRPTATVVLSRSTPSSFTVI